MHPRTVHDDVIARRAHAPRTLVEMLVSRALECGEHVAYTFLGDGETAEVQLTYGELDKKARAISVALQEHDVAGKRALLLYPPGLEFIAAFFGTIYARAIAVPAYPPDPARLARTLPRLQSIAENCQAEVVLTTVPILSMSEAMPKDSSGLQTLGWIATDAIHPDAGSGWIEPTTRSDELAFIQYTSGSTGSPKGVMLSHANLLHNAAMIRDAFEQGPDDKYVSWLPTFHDMGFMTGVLQSVFAGLPTILLSPMAFLQKPLRWLSAISRYKATISGAPNFAYDLCVRKTSVQERRSLDLSQWGVAFNGAEPIRAETIASFTEAFRQSGFRPEAFYPCYGLAEATLMVSGGAKKSTPVVRRVESSSLEDGRVRKAQDTDPRARSLVGCGGAWLDQQILIVEPENLAQLQEGQVGEILVAGPSVSRGYWGHPDETRETFHLYLDGGARGPFLRTGDLGFIQDGELFVTGRLKDLIIIRGRNHYPQDIELTVEQAHPAFRPGCAAAFAVEEAGEERLAIVQEIDPARCGDPQAAIAAIREAIAEIHELELFSALLIPPGTIPKTSSGKIQRRACKSAFIRDDLTVVAQWKSCLEDLDSAYSSRLPVTLNSV
jgi:acyl-CoA synthetase (AMP-forming)/AMP-acid ligase II